MKNSLPLRVLRYVSRAIDYVLWGAVGLILSGAIAMVLAHQFSGELGSTMASWFQAVGSIGAIIAAIAVASEQHRKEVARRTEEEITAEFLLGAEIAWLCQEISSLINRYAFVKPKQDYLLVINDDEVSDILRRLTWCRQRVKSKGQLALVGDLRRALIETVHLIRTKMQITPTQFHPDEIAQMDGYRANVLAAFNHMAGTRKAARYDT